MIPKRDPVVPKVPTKIQDLITAHKAAKVIQKQRQEDDRKRSWLGLSQSVRKGLPDYLAPYAVLDEQAFTNLDDAIIAVEVPGLARLHTRWTRARDTLAWQQTAFVNGMHWGIEAVDRDPPAAWVWAYDVLEALELAQQAAGPAANVPNVEVVDGPIPGLLPPPPGTDPELVEMVRRKVEEVKSQANG